MNLIIEYLSPTNPIASWIVIILLGFFGIWSIRLITCGIWLLAKRRQIKKNEDVQVLANARQKHDPQLEENEQKEKADAAFRKFCISRSLRERSPIAKHLKTIFLAGWGESRLEVSELIDHTTSNLFKWNGILRSVLAIFIIIGLLGTLFGLTDSLTKLAPALQTSTPDATASANSERMTQALSLLLNEMKGALAPSIWGIGLTILGVIIYSLYLGLVCQPVKSTLERLTLTVWVPQLYPTTSQRGSEAATQFGELVETVQSSISEFNQNLSRTNEITQPLSDSVSQINRVADVLNETFAQKLNEFSQQFTENVTHLTGFQDEIRNLHQTFQESANQKLDEQNQNLIATLDALKGYEATNIASREQIDETLQKFLDKTTEVNTSINTRTRELLEGIRDQLTTNLNGLTANNRELLESIRDQLTIDFNELREVLDGTLQSFLKETTAANKSINANNRELLESIRDQSPIDFDGLREVLDGTLQSFLKETTAANKSINANNRELLEGIRDQLTIDFNELREVLDGTFQNFLKETTAANKSINANNRELLEGIRDQLTTNLDELRGILDKQLETLTDQFKDFDVPLEKSADQMEKTANQMTGIVKSFVRFMKRAVGDLQIEYQEQNNQIISLLNQLARKEDIDALTASIQSLGSDSGTLSKSIGEIAQHSQTLAKATQRLARQSPSSDSTREKIPFLRRIRIPFLKRRYPEIREQSQPSPVKEKQEVDAGVELQSKQSQPPPRSQSEQNQPASSVLQELCVLYNKGDEREWRNLRNRYPHFRIGIANAPERAANPEKPPHPIFQSDSSGHFWAFHIESGNLYAVFPYSDFIMQYQFYSTGAFGEVFECPVFNPEHKYHVEVIQPALFEPDQAKEKWTLQAKGKLKLVQLD